MEAATWEPRTPLTREAGHYNQLLLRRRGKTRTHTGGLGWRPTPAGGVPD